MEAISANIQNGLIFRILGVIAKTQSDDFGKAIAFAWRPFLPIFKMVSFFE